MDGERTWERSERRGDASDPARPSDAAPLATAAAPKPQPMRLARTVALVGLMGSGKSAIGRRLAQALGARFRDADDEIERAAAMKIPEIFDRFGETYFREGERRVIARLLDEPPHVLATGGGAYMDPRTRRALARRATTLWLRADLETLVARCSRRQDRPLLRRGVRETLERLIAERYPVYAEADLVVNSRDASHEAMVEDVLAALIAQGAVGAKDAPAERG